jgi:hypothetical protein
MPGMLRKFGALVPRYEKFESISLQRRVVQTIGSWVAMRVEVPSLLDGLCLTVMDPTEVAGRDQVVNMHVPHGPAHPTHRKPGTEWRRPT